MPWLKRPNFCISRAYILVNHRVLEAPIDSVQVKWGYKGERNLESLTLVVHLD